jgi:hydrogenase nickel incorporation protein HypA/HybF
MHELSVAQRILEIAEEKARGSGLCRITGIKVRIGSLTTVVPEALDFCFGFAREDTLAGNANLIIEKIQAEARCNSCKLVFPVEQSFFLVCPSCGSSDTSLLKGTELDLLSIEGET